ncbi:MAG: hypothetical protein A3J65_00850 [Candidatus Buchananbacteria bacterium RIFCSPHIGHO2_02_FULL_45_11b]|uniref:YdbS-like PH domain-containing protein n=4 Tax=Candidatus Buchananiibacteriota TaxID=1817903 RepID=A0A1G1Y413_9BACT|nr:MAG: hypothetical protein A2663_03980 [Candidatus Buchananbacteria bacterium RIFCSPHIGHO2_01_FULL_46_12]OGY52326.1 MAG: hypothetical protein A3J65_00850 [Candidatus Buchananbacteria bacterium RIFCSPHIGHO2_02_FULL_45_11b]OGY53193.1 MAG: hypothetical protein A3B15_02830 [Candidatus Buchananbacteria bacterium RIFCSPLOWO2_01_FULL_45_31]OGY56719.1 MAG: hypothetical protein A3H67_04870 [Candidatus Buchananbacteria bacterium RIFCSPLOWO2_02_FULL_46_11b]HLC89825.1 PH domain-containing protein [Patesc
MPNLACKNLILNDDEQFIQAVRQSKNQLFFALIPPLILILAPFFFLFPLFARGNLGAAIFFASLLLGLVWALRLFIVWYYRVFIITNQRLIDVDQQGVFTRIVSSEPLIKIQDVFYQIKGVWQTFARCGTVRITIAESKTAIEIRNIPQPQKIQQLILQLKADTLREKFDTTSLSAQELVNLVKKIKAGLGEDKFKQILEESDEPEESKEKK